MSPLKAGKRNLLRKSKSLGQTIAKSAAASVADIPTIISSKHAYVMILELWRVATMSECDCGKGRQGHVGPHLAGCPSNTIYDRLRERVEFDPMANDAVLRKWEKKFDVSSFVCASAFMAAEQAENARLTPLITALIAEVKRLREALEYYQETDNWPYATKGKCPGAAARNALAASDKALEEVLDGTKDL